MPKSDDSKKYETEEDTEGEYERWKKPVTPKPEPEPANEASPTPEPRRMRPRRQQTCHMDTRKDRRIADASEIPYYESMDHLWVSGSPYYVRLGRRPSFYHKIIAEHWHAQKKLWNVSRCRHE